MPSTTNDEAKEKKEKAEEDSPFGNQSFLLEESARDLTNFRTAAYSCIIPPTIISSLGHRLSDLQ
jgi:hypothetical protein